MTTRIVKSSRYPLYDTIVTQLTSDGTLDTPVKNIEKNNATKWISKMNENDQNIVFSLIKEHYLQEFKLQELDRIPYHDPNPDGPDGPDGPDTSGNVTLTYNLDNLPNQLLRVIVHFCRLNRKQPKK